MSAAKLAVAAAAGALVAYMLLRRQLDERSQEVARLEEEAARLVASDGAQQRAPECASAQQGKEGGSDAAAAAAAATVAAVAVAVAAAAKGSVASAAVTTEPEAPPPSPIGAGSASAAGAVAATHKGSIGIMKEEEIGAPFVMEEIGTVRSAFPHRAGTPRQGTLAPHARSCLELHKTKIQADALDKLDGFSHVWVIFRFHINVDPTKKRARELAAGSKVRTFSSKVKPPRAGYKVGVFSTRSPHRPNPVGASPGTNTPQTSTPAHTKTPRLAC